MLTALSPVLIVADILQYSLSMREPVLEELGVELVLYIQHFYNEGGLGVDEAELFKLSVRSMIGFIKDLFHKSCCHAMAKQFNSEMNDLGYLAVTTSANKLPSVKLISFYIKELFMAEQKEILGDDFEGETDRKTGLPGKMTVTHSMMTSASTFAEYLIPILISLATGLDKVSDNIEHLEFTLPVLNLIQEMLTILE